MCPTKYTVVENQPLCDVTEEVSVAHCITDALFGSSSEHKAVSLIAALAALQGSRQVLGNKKHKPQQDVKCVLNGAFFLAAQTHSDARSCLCVKKIAAPQWRTTAESCRRLNMSCNGAVAASVQQFIVLVVAV